MTDKLSSDIALGPSLSCTASERKCRASSALIKLRMWNACPKSSSCSAAPLATSSSHGRRERDAAFSAAAAAAVTSTEWYEGSAFVLDAADDAEGCDADAVERSHTTMPRPMATAATSSGTQQCDSIIIAAWSRVF
eukprot:1237201-Prymnesium_polylepis.2